MVGDEPGDRPQDGRLPAPGLADQPERSAPLDREAYVGERPERAEAHAEGVDLQHRRAQDASSSQRGSRSGTARRSALRSSGGTLPRSARV